MTLPDVDPARVEAEWAADKEVLASLAENGDVAGIVRLVDVSFRGDENALDRLEDDAESLGFTFIEREETEDGELATFLGSEQTAEADAIRALTVKCLQIELAYDVEYDGWGCTAETGKD
jgi:hypothetical protein